MEEIELEIMGHTPAAWKVSDGDIECWLPKSQVELDESAQGMSGETAMFLVPQWLLEEKGLC